MRFSSRSPGHFAGAEAPPTLLTDAVFALVTELGRRGTKTRQNPKRIELMRPAEREDGFDGYFGCPVKYRASRDALVLRAADLELPFVTQELLQMLAPQFENQLEQGRAKLVRQYLGNPTVEITKPAFLVGYEDPNSFYRAFRSWEGKTPAEWPASNQAHPSTSPENQQLPFPPLRLGVSARKSILMNSSSALQSL